MNEYIRKALRINNIKQWQVAEVMGVSEFTLSRWLRKELNTEQKMKCVRAINTIIDERNTGRDRFDNSANLDYLHTDCAWK